MLIFRQKSFKFCTPPSLENSTTRTTLLSIVTDYFVLTIHITQQLAYPTHHNFKSFGAKIQNYVLIDFLTSTTYHLDGQVFLKSCVVNHLMDKKKVDNNKTNKKRVNNTNFKTNLTVQVVCMTM
jgi:hypothetical protein